jgi:hypothetical protein
MEEDFETELIQENAIITRRISELRYGSKLSEGYDPELERLQNRLKLNEMVLYNIS